MRVRHLSCILAEVLFLSAILVGIYLTMVAICISLIISKVGHFSTHLLVIWKSFFVRCLLKSCAYFSIELTTFY